MPYHPPLIGYSIIMHIPSLKSVWIIYRRRERHAKTIDIAQEEVLTCLGIHLYERLHRIWQKLRAEEQTWQMLFYLGIDALRKSFEVKFMLIHFEFLNGTFHEY